MKKTALLAILAGVSWAPIQAGNVILNAGFETGDFTSWNVTLASNGSDLFVSGAQPRTGNDSAVFGGTTAGDYDTITQSFNDVSGQAYNFSFFLNGELPDPVIIFQRGNDAAAITPLTIGATFDSVAEFQVFWDGNMVLDSFNGNSDGSFPFTQFSFQETGTGNDTIEFRGYNVPFRYTLDDVAVDGPVPSTVPEPSTWLAIAAGLASLAVRARSSRTDRAPTGWD